MDSWPIAVREGGAWREARGAREGLVLRRRARPGWWCRSGQRVFCGVAAIPPDAETLTV